MKKGILNLVLLVLVLINLIMTLILVFSIVPNMSNTNKLITKISSIIDLEVPDDETADDGGVIPASQKEVFQIEDKLTNKLKEGSDGEAHYATGYVAVYLDKEHEDYETMAEIMPDQDVAISAQIKKVMSNFTMAEFDSDISAVEEAVLEDLQEYFGSDAICEVALDMVAS